MSESNELPAAQDAKGRYRSHLGKLKELQDKLAIEGPSSAATIDGGIAAPHEGRPSGGQLPVYDIDEAEDPSERVKKSMMNVASLTGVFPNQKKK